MGRPRKSKRLKQLQGTHRPDRDPPAPPPPGMPTMPTGLDKAAKQEWNRLAPKLHALEVLYETDGSLLGNLCAAQALAMKATRGYQKGGLMITQYGQKVKNPLIKVAQEARSQMQQHLAEFNRRIAARAKEEGLDAAVQKLKEAQRLADAGAGAPADPAAAFFFDGPKLVKPSAVPPVEPKRQIIK